MKKASETLTPVILELGGKDAAVVFSDCSYPETKSVLLRAALQNAGQNCAGLERIVIQDSLYGKFAADITQVYSKLRVGCDFHECVDGNLLLNPVGGITFGKQLEIVKALVDDAVEKGAKVLVGGKVYDHPTLPQVCSLLNQGQFYAPTILADITPEMKIYHHEVFGPVILLFKFSTEQEAIDIVNATEFGLGSAVFTRDYVKAARVSAAFDAGMSNVNGWGFNYLCQSLPFGGIKQSGFDRFGGVEGLRGNCHVVAATTDKFGWLGIRTGVPGVLDYPVSRRSVAFQEGLIDVIYGRGLKAKMGGLKGVFKSLF